MNQWNLCDRYLSYSAVEANGKDGGEYTIRHSHSEDKPFLLYYAPDNTLNLDLIAAGTIPELMATVNEKESK